MPLPYHTHRLSLSHLHLMGSWHLAQNMTAVCFSGPVPTNAIVHGGLADPSDVMPVPVPIAPLPPATHPHTHTPVIIKQSLTSGELIEVQERPGTHPPTGLFYPHFVCLATQLGESAHTHTIYPLQKKQHLYYLFLCYSSIPGALWFSWFFTVTQTSPLDQSLRMTPKKNATCSN